MITDPAPFAPFALGMSLPTLLGVGGFLIYAGADIALCLRRISSEGISFYLYNIVAAALIGVSLLYSFNLGAFLTEMFCLGVSALAVILRLRDRRLRRSEIAGASGASFAAIPAQHALHLPRSRPTQGARAMQGPASGRAVGAARPGGGLCPDRMI